MKAILKRELYSYFVSPIAYIFISVFYASSGLYFFATCLYANSTSFTYIFSNMFSVILVLIPLLTMRIWTEDKKQKTDQALFTSPSSTFSIVLGKYLAAVIIFLISIASIVVYGIIISLFVMPDWAVIFGNLVGIILLGMALIAIGMFISALTESQVVAAIETFAINMIIMLMDSISGLFNSATFNNVLTAISFSNHYTNFTLGILNFADVIFYLSATTIFIFLTVRMFEKKRWS